MDGGHIDPGSSVFCLSNVEDVEDEDDDEEDEDEDDDVDGDEERGDGEKTGVYGIIVEHACSWATTGTCCWVAAATNNCGLIIGRAIASPLPGIPGTTEAVAAAAAGAGAGRAS